MYNIPIMKYCWACGKDLVPIIRRIDNRHTLKLVLEEKLVLSAFDIGHEWYCFNCHEPR